MINLMQLVHGYDIFQNYIHTNYSYRPIGWNVDKELFSTLIHRTEPKYVLELGSWYGASTIAMGQIIKELNLATQIICVDTWLGSKEFIGLHENDDSRKLFSHFGYPNAYYQFLSNICYNNLTDIIIPIPNTFQHACSWLTHKNISVDLIYVDGDNDVESVYCDLTYSWPLLNNNGIIFGDDFNNPAWPGIRMGLNKFCNERMLKYTTLGNDSKFWMIHKTHL